VFHVDLITFKHELSSIVSRRLWGFLTTILAAQDKNYRIATNMELGGVTYRLTFATMRYIIS
jgi:hypothetical protein